MLEINDALSPTCKNVANVPNLDSCVFIMIDLGKIEQDEYNIGKM